MKPQGRIFVDSIDVFAPNDYRVEEIVTIDDDLVLSRYANLKAIVDAHTISNKTSFTPSVNWVLASDYLTTKNIFIAAETQIQVQLLTTDGTMVQTKQTLHLVLASCLIPINCFIQFDEDAGNFEVMIYHRYR